MAILTNERDLTHIVRTTEQWLNTVDKYEIIPEGVLCVEFTSDNLTKVKIGDGHKIFSDLPYITGSDVSDYYSKKETDERIIELIHKSKSLCIKGKLGSTTELPTLNNVDGDVWFVKVTKPSGLNHYEEYVWFDNQWELLGSYGDIDLTNYVTKQEFNKAIEDLSKSTHTHTNKEILDQTDAVFNKEKDKKLKDLHNYDDTEIRELITETGHTHSNKDILDKTTASFTKEQANELTELSDIPERVQVLENVSHSHENKEILDRTTAAFTREQAIQLLDCKDMVGATAEKDGEHGFVPKPTIADRTKFLRGDGTWVKVEGGGGGTSLDPGDGIDITDDVISVKLGDGLSFDDDGNIKVNAEPGSYESGDAIRIDSGESSSEKIPEEYQQVTYIQSSGYQYIKTGYKPKSTTRILMRIISNDNTSRGWSCLLGSRRGSYGSDAATQVIIMTHHANSGNVVEYWLGSSDKARSTIFPYGELVDIECQGNSLTWTNVETGDTETLSNSTNIMDTDYELYLFTLNHNNSEESCRSNTKLYSFKIYENDTLVRNYVPAYNKTSIIVGLYETVTKTFMTSATNTDLISGLPVEDEGNVINVEYSDGLTINDENALVVKTGSGIGIDDDGNVVENILRLTKSEYESQKDDIPDDTLFMITDDYVDELQIASETTLGVVKIGEGISIDEDGTISADSGGVSFTTGDGLNLSDDNVLSVKTGEGLSIDDDGNIQVDFPSQSEYLAGDGISIDNVDESYNVLTYIESTGTQKIISDISFTSTNQVLKFNVCTTDTTKPGIIFNVGSYVANGTPVYWLKDGKAQVGRGDGSTCYWSDGYSISNNVFFEDTASFIDSLSSSTKTGSTTYVSYLVTNQTLTFFGPAGVYDPRNAYARLSYINIYDDGVMIAQMVPVKRTSDSVIGLYDKVNEKFYTNNYNDTAFLGGSETGVVITTGTQKKITNTGVLDVKESTAKNQIIVTTKDGDSPVDIDIDSEEILQLTKEEYEAQKETIPDDTLFIITDDFEEGGGCSCPSYSAGDGISISNNQSVTNDKIISNDGVLEVSESTVKNQIIVTTKDGDSTVDIDTNMLALTLEEYETEKTNIPEGTVFVLIDDNGEESDISTLSGDNDIIANSWVTLTGISDNFYDNFTDISTFDIFYNESCKRMSIVINGELTGDISDELILGYITNDKKPRGNVRELLYENDFIANIIVSSEDGSVTLKKLSGENITSGYSINVQMEWSII